VPDGGFSGDLRDLHLSCVIVFFQRAAADHSVVSTRSIAIRGLL
jgi:hypothetical protein